MLRARATQLLCGISAAGALGLFLSSPAAAQTWRGATSNDWTDGSNWTGNAAPTTGAVIINTPSNPAVLGVSGAATGTTGDFSLGTAGGSGNLTFQNGSTLTSNPTGYVFVGRHAGSDGGVNVTGAGSTWNINGIGNSLILGQIPVGTGIAPTGTLNISNGGAVSTAGDIVVGETRATGVLSVSSGGTLTTGRDAYIGRFVGSNGTATTTGAGSSWDIAGRLYVGNGGPGALTISDNAIVTVGTTTYVADSGSAGTLNITGGGTLRTQALQRAAGAGTPQVNFNGGTLRATADNASFITGFSGTQLNVAAGGLTIDTDGFNVAASSPFSGTGGLTKAGSGTLTLNGANPYTGTTIVDAGRLVLSNANGFASATIVNSAATLTFTGTGNVSAAASITLNDGATLENINPSGYAHLLGAVTSTGNTSINANASAGPNRRFYLDGGLRGSGTVTINAASAGNAVVLRNNNSTFSGTLIVNGIANATAGAGSGLALGGLATSNALINTDVVLNGTIELADQGIGSGFGTGTFNMGALSGSGIIVANRNPVGGNFGSTLVLGNTNGSGLFSGSIIRGSGVTNVVGVTKVGTGTQIFSGASTYEGVTNVNAGVLNIRNNTALGSTVRGTNVASGAALQIEGDIAVGAEALTLNGTGIANDGALRNISGANSYGGPITLGSAVRINSDEGMLTLGTITGATQNLTLGGAGNTTITGVLGITSGTLSKDGSGTAILLGANTYTGATIVNGGTLQAGEAAGGTAFGALSAVTLADVGGTTLNLNSFDQTIGSLDGGGATGGNVMLGSATLTTGGNGGNTMFGGAIEGTGALVKVGAGTQALTGASTYTGGTTISAGALRLGNGGTTGSIVGDVTNSGALEFFRSNTMTFAGAISGSGTIRQIGSGLTDLTADSSAFTGTTLVEAGTLAVNGTLCGPMNVLAGGRLQGTGTVCDTTNAGVVAPGNSIGTLTIDGDYVGSGGTLEIETVLGNDASPTDLLHVTGNTSGTTSVDVINLGGAGALTTEGIRIVQVDGTSDGDFALLGDYVFQGDQAVVGGAYGYRLYKNGVSTPGDGDWYLRSALTDPVDPTIPPDPTAPQLPQQPLYAPTTPLYEAYAGVLQSFNEVGTLRQRVGSNPIVALGAPEEGSEGARAIRTRIEAAHSHLEPGTSTTGVGYDVNTWKLHAGLEALLAENANGALIGGVSLHYGTASANISSIFGTGDIDTTGYGFGGTLTWYGNSGLYVDAQAQLTWFDSDLHSAALGRSLVVDNDGFGYALGIETGQKIALSSRWSLTPQAQLTYSSVRFDDFADSFGGAVSLGDGDALIGRLGISADYENAWQDGNGLTSRSSFYGVANLYYDFLDGSDVDVSGTRFVNESQALWGGLGLGGTYSWSGGRYSVNGEAFVRTSLEDFGDSNSVGAKVSFRVTW